jgi:hypothetical protein
MAQLHLDGDDLQVTFTATEKLAGAVRDVRVPLAAVRDVTLVPRPSTAPPGLRSPGLAVPRRRWLGTWRRPGHQTVTAVERDQPAVHVRLTGARPDELIISTPDAAPTAGRLRRRVGLPAHQEEVRITSDQVTLAGTLALPGESGPHPVALILPGSGEVNRDGDHQRLPLAVSLDLARALSAHGIGSLRYDKRGVGRSTGNWRSAGVGDNLNDAAAALAWLRGHPEVREDAIFLVGHSEGALLATALAAKDTRLSGVVLLSAPAKTGEATLAWQTLQVSQTLPSFTKRVLRLLRIDVIDKQRQAVATLRTTTTDTVRIAGRVVNARWQRELLDFDPQPLLATIRVPVLAITGDKDIQVDPGDLHIIGDVVPGPVDTVRVPNLTHLLRRSSVPGLRAYRRLARRPTDPEVLAQVGTWAAEHVPAPATTTPAERSLR